MPSFYIEPVPEKGDFRIDLDNEFLSEAADKFEAQVRKMYAEGLKREAGDLLEEMRALAENLGKEGKAGMIKETMVERTIKMAQKLMNLNVMKDRDLDFICKEVVKLGKIDIETMRKRPEGARQDRARAGRTDQQAQVGDEILLAAIQPKRGREEMTAITKPKIEVIDLDKIMEDSQIKLSQSKFKLQKYEAFWATLLAKLEVVWTFSLPTMATDGKHLFCNPLFLERCTLQELIGVDLHECLHVALGHHLRRGNRNPRKWNRAADYAVNDIIVNSSNFSNALVREVGYVLPDRCLIDPKFHGMTAEQIYDALPDQPEDNQPDGSMSGGDDLFDYPGAEGAPGDAPSEADLKEGQRKLKEDTMMAREIARKAGHGSILGEMITKEINKSEVDWKSIFKQFVDNVFYTDVDWSRPNRRYVSQGKYLPGPVKDDGLSTVCFIFDTSGSTIPDRAQFHGEAQAMMETHPARIIAIYCDSAVQHVDIFDDAKDFKMKPINGGGTSFKPPFKWLDDNDITPICTVYLTDGYGDYPDEPSYPVLWAMTTDQVAPWGDTVKTPFTSKKGQRA